ncbi:MAG: hypothetical protein FWD61_16585 [Phycisphaerales bacterium]|nr:hypothetical protein [Phycisphaerales bacterium]
MAEKKEADATDDSAGTPSISRETAESNAYVTDYRSASSTAQEVEEKVAPAKDRTWRERWGQFRQWFRQWLNYSDPDFQVGSLVYKRKALLVMCLWLLWGDLVFSLCDGHVYGACMALQLDRIDIPKDWIGYIMGTAGAWIHLFMVPIVSFRSDRTRSRMGRRIPYIIWTIVPLSICLAALGFTDDIAAYIRASDWPDRLHLEPTHLVIIVIAAMIIVFDVANVFVNCVWWYLIRDVVPPKFIARFMTVFGIVGTLTNMLWTKIFFPMRQTHTAYLYVGASLLYLFGFGLMCLMVKEGTYPPPGAIPHRASWFARFREACKIYFTQSFQHPLIVMQYAGTAIGAFVGACAFCQTFFYVRYLGFKDKDLADFGFYTLLIILVIKYPIGWLIDKKIHPMKTVFYSSLLLLPVPFFNFYMQDYQFGTILISAFTIYMAIALYQLPIVQFNSLSDFPLKTKLFPAAQYGQFSSANQVVGNVIRLGASIVGARFMGWMNDKFGQEGNKYLWLWQGLFGMIAFTSMCVMFRYWHLFGGANFKLDLNAPPDAGGPSKAQLWRPIKIGACVAAMLLAVGVYGMIVLVQRPNVFFEINKDHHLMHAKSLEHLEELVAKERQDIEARHADNLRTLAKKHLFWQHDAAVELANYQSSFQTLEAAHCHAREKFEKAGAKEEPVHSATTPATQSTITPYVFSVHGYSRP